MHGIAGEGRGLVVYEQQEGRGIGLMSKLRAYALQDAGLDTIDANLALGFAPDCRDFTLSAAIVQFLGISCVCLLSNNPPKTRALLRYDIEIVAEIPREASPTPYRSAYFRTKRERVGHKLSLGAYESIGDAPLPRVETRSTKAEIADFLS